MNDVKYFLMNRRILTVTALYYHKKLLALDRFSQPWEYIKTRGITEESVVKNMIGVSAGHGLHEYLVSMGYFDSMIVKNKLSNLRIHKELGKQRKDFMSKGRITIPCISEGRVLNIVGRIHYETDNLAIPRYLALSGNDWMFMSPDSIDMTRSKDIYVCEGPIDKIILEQIGVQAVCFLGTSGWKEEYDHWLPNYIYCIPDADDSTQARKANMKMYVKAADRLEYRTKISIIELPRDEKEKIDPASLFAHKDIEDAGVMLNILIRSAKHISNYPEWETHQKSKEIAEEKKINRWNLHQQAEKIEKFPIVDALELLGVDILEGCTGRRPTCRCFNPEHDDHNPSVHIYEETQTWHCFGCGAGNDAIDAAMIIRGLEFKEAIEFLKEARYESKNIESV